MRHVVLRFTVFATVSVLGFAREPIAEDRGAAGLSQAVRKLQTSVRVLSVTAHPDDEDAGTLTYLSRGRGADLTMLILNRGESGANLVSSDFFEGLGALRTGEMLRAAEYYGAKVRFTRFVDYGFSKTMEETFRNWKREDVLRDCVRIVRAVRPHVIVSRFQGTSRDGHGNHQAAGLMAQLMFDAAADATFHPELGAAWTVQKLYLGGWRQDEPWTVAVDSGVYDPVLGRSYAQIGREGYRWHRSQGMALAVAAPGPSVSYYKLAKSTVGMADREKDMLERVRSEPVPAVDATPARIAAYLQAVRGTLKEPQAIQALALTLGIELDAVVEPDERPTGPFAMFRAVETMSFVTPGVTPKIAVTPHIRGEHRVEVLGTGVRGGADRVTRAYWRRASVKESTYEIDESLFGEPLPPAPYTGWARFRFEGVEFELATPVETSKLNPIGGQYRRPLAVAPPVSVSFASVAGILPAGVSRYRVTVNVRNNVFGPVNGALRLAGAGTARPASVGFTFEKEGEERNTVFEIESAAGGIVEAVAEVNGAEYRDSFQPIGQPGTEIVYLAAPARHEIRPVDVRVSKGLRVGYIMGTGDQVPSGLEQLGVEYDLLDAAAIATGDLSRYSTILVGIRAYAARPELKIHNARLLEYTERGGVLVVQYNTQEFDQNFGPYPYQMTMRAEEISEEDAPVEILDSSDPVFQSPNTITAADFEGWIEQRGSKFMAMWDSRYKPLIASNDTGQAPQRGGWLVARHGQGLYVYCAYAWYRQIPYAVPGAMRIFANLVSLGAKDAAWRGR
jgi:LmbE family N-acetylglucosaminyl deacetylase